MKSFLLRAAAPATLMLVGASLYAEPASTIEPQDSHGEHAGHGEMAQHDAHAGHAGRGDSNQVSSAKADAVATAEATSAERICRSVKLDMSSRRKSKVCKTADGWREFNQRR